MSIWCTPMPVIPDRGLSAGFVRQLLRSIVRPRRARLVGLDRHDLAHLPAVDHLLDPPVGRLASAVVTDLQHHSGLGCGLDRPATLLHVSVNGFSTKTCLPAAAASQRRSA